MNDPEIRFDELLAILKEHDFRLTPQRVELIRLIAASEDHPSASQLYEKIKVQFPTMSPATVYKTLAMLKEINQVFEIDLPDDRHYDGGHPHPHAHLICIKCNQIIDGEASLDPQVIKELEKVSGYSILRPQISLYGLCPDCKDKR